MKILKFLSNAVLGAFIGFLMCYVGFYTYSYYLELGQKRNPVRVVQNNNPPIENPSFIKKTQVTQAKVEDQIIPKTTTKINVPVLMYHHVRPIEDIGTTSRGLVVTPEDFEAQIKLLSDNNFKSISLSELAQAIKKKGEISMRSFAITFDDGYSDTYRYAYPILQKYGYSGTVFLISHNIDAIGGYLKTSQITAMQEDGWELGSHTLTHHNLLTLDPSRALLEILKSKEELQRLFNTTIHFFCYPVGNYNANITQLVKNSGYRGGLQPQKKGS